MAIFLYRLKFFIQTVLALACLAFVLCVMWAMNVSRFSAIEGDRVFYLQSASSQGLRKEELALSDFPNIRGESLCFALPDGTDATDFVMELAEEYGAVILFVEQVGNVRSYYGHTLRWTDGVMINGRKINLHIAVREDTATGVVGTPIIFDGY